MGVSSKSCAIILLFLMLLQQDALAKFKQEDCTRLQEPKMKRSCCKVPHTDDVIKKCRSDLLSGTTAHAKHLKDDKVELHICIAECEFKAKSYLTAPNAVDLKLIEADLKKHHAQDLDYVQLLLKGLRKCKDFARNKTQEVAWMRSADYCNIFPATLLACALEEVYENCPPKKWHATPECEQMRNFLLKCDELKQN